MDHGSTVGLMVVTRKVVVIEVSTDSSDGGADNDGDTNSDDEVLLQRLLC